MPIVATSCNYAGEKPMVDMQSILEAFQDKVEAIIDGGKEKIELPSTVIQVKEREVIVLRQGTIQKEEIMKVISEKK